MFLTIQYDVFQSKEMTIKLCWDAYSKNIKRMPGIMGFAHVSQVAYFLELLKERQFSFEST